MEKFKKLNTSDIFLLLSCSEGLSISILEAMAAGLPIISNTLGAIPEVVTNEINGYLLSPGDYKSLSHYILTLVLDLVKRFEMRRQNKELIKKEYDINTICNKISLVYIDI